jgi:hypothetical protein
MSTHMISSFSMNTRIHNLSSSCVRILFSFFLSFFCKPHESQLFLYFSSHGKLANFFLCLSLSPPLRPYSQLSILKCNLIKFKLLHSMFRFYTSQIFLLIEYMNTKLMGNCCRRERTMELQTNPFCIYAIFFQKNKSF